jgi:hypothetical protein
MITPLEVNMEVQVQKDVVFYDDQLTAVQADDGGIYVSISQLCSTLGLAAQSQRRRIEEHDVLNEGLVQLPVQTAGGKQTVYMLRHDLVPLWLAGVQGKSTREEVRPKLKRYQMEAAKVLFEAFHEGRLTMEPDLGDLALVSPESLQALQMAHAIVALARNQILIEQRLGGRIENLEMRLETVEDALAPKDRYVTQDQASQLSQAVKAVALALGKKSGRNEFQGVYGELYRRHGITSYKLLPARQFERAMGWLTEWYQSITGDDLPF